MSTQTFFFFLSVCWLLMIFWWSPSSRLMYCSLLPWLPVPVSTCCNLTVVGWRLLAHLHKAIRWDTNELSKDTGDNTRVLDSDTLPPHVNQPATVSFPHSVSVICGLRLCFWEEGTKNIEESIINAEFYSIVIFVSFAVCKSHCSCHHSCYSFMGRR